MCSSKLQDSKLGDDQLPARAVACLPAPCSPLSSWPAFSIPFSSTQFGNVCYGPKEDRDSGKWKKIFDYVSAGPDSVSCWANANVVKYVYSEPGYCSYPFMITAIHVEKTHQRSSICSSCPAKCSALITTHHFWAREAQSSATTKIQLILPPTASCYFEEQPEDENTG